MVDPLSTSPDWQNHTGSVIILPVGAFEQHGNHMPLDTDSLLAEYYCRWLSKALDAALLPALRFGTSMEHRGFRGSISLRPETLMQIIRDITDEVELQGFRILVVASFHGGNHCLVPVARDLNRADRPLKILLFSSSQHWPQGITQSEREGYLDIHAGEAETSTMLAAYPKLVRDHRRDMPPRSDGITQLTQNDLTTFGIGVLHETGEVGRPSLASAEKGERILCEMKKSGLAWLRDRIELLEKNPRYAGAGGISIREMREDDIASGMQIKEKAGWNQTESDWHFFLESNRHGCYSALHMGSIVGTVITIKYTNLLAWVGMVLVDPLFRNLKIASHLMMQALQYLDNCETVKLDATPAGLEVYSQLGFKKELGLTRMTSMSVLSDKEIPQGISPLRSIEIVAKLDFEAFGSNRLIILKSLLKRAPNASWKYKKNDEILAFCLGRLGTRFNHIGPVVARDGNSAKQIITAALYQLRGKPAVIDILDHQKAIFDLLMQHGFVRERPFTRMFKGSNNAPGKPKLVFASAGPELG